MVFSLFEKFDMLPQSQGPQGNVHFCKKSNTVIAHCRMGRIVNGQSEKGRILIEQGLQEWSTECVLFVRMDVEGKRVVEVKEFVNSAKAKELQKRSEGLFEG
jgi:chloramphenicol 3-O-phosphotransferase